MAVSKKRRNSVFDAIDQMNGGKAVENKNLSNKELLKRRKAADAKRKSTGSSASYTTTNKSKVSTERQNAVFKALDSGSKNSQVSSSAGSTRKNYVNTLHSSITGSGKNKPEVKSSGINISKINEQVKSLPKTELKAATAEDVVKNRVEQEVRPSFLDQLIGSSKISNSGNTARGVSASFKSSGNPAGRDPDSLYRTDNMSERERLAWEMAARNDERNPLTIAENTKTNADTSKKEVYDLESYTLMTDEEKKRYNEIYGVYGKAQAEEYHDLILDDINKRIADKAYETDANFNNPLSRTIYMFGQGAAEGVGGLREAGEWMLGIDRTKAAGVGENIASNIRSDEDNSTLENVAYDIAQSTGYMAPGLITSGALSTAGVAAGAAQAAGNTMFGLAQAGNTYREDLNEGKDANKASLHALQQGVDESATNWLLGGINAFGGGGLKRMLGNTSIGRAAASGIESLAKTNKGRVILRRVRENLTNMGSEAAQEYLQFYTENLTSNLIYGEDNSLDLLDPDAWYAAALGALNAGLLNMPGNVARTASGINADVSHAGETAEALDLDRSHYESDEDFRKVERLKTVAEEIAAKEETGSVGVMDRIAYNEALADVLSSEGNTAHNESLSENSEQVRIDMLPVRTDSENAARISMDEATEQWRKILTNPKLTAAVSTDGITSYDVERTGDTFIFTRSSAEETAPYVREFNVSDIGRGGDTDILSVMPLQSDDASVPKLSTFVNYDNSIDTAEVDQEAAFDEATPDAELDPDIPEDYNSLFDNEMPAAENNAEISEDINNYEEAPDNINDIDAAEDAALQDVAADDTLYGREQPSAEEPGTRTPESSEEVSRREPSETERAEFKDYQKEYSAALATKESTDNMIDLWDGRNRDGYLSAYKRVYTAGLNGIDTATVYDYPSNVYLSNEAMFTAYKDGMRDANKKKAERKELTKGEEREGGITQGEGLATEDQKIFLNWVGDKTGLKIEIREGLKGSAEIDLKRGVMRINPYAEDFVGSTAHELTHMIKVYAPKEYDTLQRLTVEALMKSNNESYEELYARYEKAYREEVDPDYTVEDILEEITADGATAYMNDAEFAEKVARNDKSLAKKIADFFRDIAGALRNIINDKGLRKVGRVMRENEARYRMAAATWQQGLMSAGERFKAGYETGLAMDAGERRYSIMRSESGVEFVHVDTILVPKKYLKDTGLSKKKARTYIRKNIRKGGKSKEELKYAEYTLKEFFQGKKYKIGGKRVIFNSDDVKKLVYGEKSATEARIKIASEFDNLLKIARYYKTEPEKKGRKEYKNYDYHEVYFHIGEDFSKNYYKGLINIRNRADGVSEIYTVSKIEKVDEEVLSNSSSVGESQGFPGRKNDNNSSAVDANITQNNAEVNDTGTNEMISEGENTERAASNIRRQLNIDEDTESINSDNLLTSSNKELREATETLGTLLSSLDYVPSDKAIERTAKRLKKYTATNTSIEAISEQLKTFYAFIAASGHVDGKLISDTAADYAGELISNSMRTAYDPAAEREYKRYRDAVKGYTFYLPKGFEGELETLGGIRAIRREFFGTLNLTKDKGVSIDTMYQELAELYPDMFNSDRANPADQLEDIIDHLRMLKPKPNVSYANEGDYDAYRYYAGQEIFKAYIAEGAAEAGRRSEYQSLKREYNKKLKENEKSETEMAGLQAKAAEMQARYLSELAESKKKISRQTMRERVIEARQSTKKSWYKNQIIKDTKELSRWLTKPTDKNHVPEALRVPLAEFLTNVDFSSSNLNNNGDPTQRTLLWMNLKDTWAKIAEDGGVTESGGETLYLEFDRDIVAKMQELTEKIKTMERMDDLDFRGLAELSGILKNMKHTITTAGELMSTNRYKTVAEAAESTIEHLESVKARIDRAGFLGAAQKLLQNDMLDATTRFHTFGTAAEDILGGVRRGFNQKIRRTAEAEKAFKEALKRADVTTKEMNSWSGDRAETIKFEASDGNTYEFTIAQVMSLYELMKRPQALDHILVGGITSQKLSLRGKYLKTGNIKVNKLDVANIVSNLTDKQKALADGITAYFQTTAQWGNNATMQLYGYKKFNDPNYFPIQVDRNYLTTTSDEAARGTDAVAIKNLGMTKSTVPHANNPLVINDIFDVFTKQVNDMSNYEAFMVPLTDLQKWYNFKDLNINPHADQESVPMDWHDPNLDRDKYETSIKKLIERSFGSEANVYIRKFMEDINGMSNNDRYFAKGLISAFKGSAVGANLSVAIQQPTAYVRAMAVIDPKYLVKAMATKAETGSWEDIKERSSIAQWKDWGFYEMDTGRTMRNILTDPDTLMDKLKEYQMLPAALGDQIAWKRLWIAAELKVKDENPGIDVKGDEFLDKVAAEFDSIIDRTQVVDSVFHRTQVMRSKNDLSLMATSFMAEPMKSYNMLYRAAFDFYTADGKAKKEIAGKMLVRSGIAFVLSNTFAAMAKSLITAMRDKDEDRTESYWNRWAGHFTDELAGNLNPVSYIPFVKDIQSIFEGYSVTRSDVQAFNDLNYAATRWKSYFKGDNKYTLSNNILYSLKAVSTFSGLALYGLQRDVNAIIDTAIEAFGSGDIRYGKQKALGYKVGDKRNTGYYLSMALEAYSNDNTALGDKIIGDMMDAGIPEEKIETALKTKLTNYIKDDADNIKAIEKALDGDKNAINEYKDKLKAMGYNEETIDSSVSSSIQRYAESEDLNYKGLNATLDSVTDYTQKGYAEFYSQYAEWAELSKLKNGWDKEKCRSNFRSQCTQYFKPLYKDGDAKERSRILNILSRIKIDGKKLYEEKDIKTWGNKK